MSTQTTVLPTTPEALLAIIVDKKKSDEYKSSAAPFLKAAQGFTIEDKADYDYSITIAEEAIKRRKVKEEWIKPAKKLTDMLHGLLCEMERQMIADDVEIERLIKDRRMNWREAQERLRVAQENEARRIAQEAQHAAALAEAAQLEKEGEKEAAQVVVEQALAAPPPAIVIQSSVAKQAGSSIRKKYSYRMDDEAKVPREFCSPDPKKLRAHVDAYGMQANIAGITVYPDENEAIRTKGR